MNSEHFPAVLLILGFVSVLAASSIGPPNLYQEPVVKRQLELIEEYRPTWIASNVLFGTAGLLTAAGLVLFALQPRETGSVLPVSGAAAYSLGVAAYAVFLYRRTINPAELFTDYSFSPLTIFLLAGLVTGLFLIGLAFIQTGYPRWLGIGTVAGMALIGGAALFFPAQFFKVFPPQALFLFTLAAGIVMWRQ